MDKNDIQKKFSSKNNNGNKKDGKNNSKFNLTWVYIGLLALLFVMIFSNNRETSSKIPYTKFQECMDSGYVDNIFVNKTEQELTFEIKKDYRFKVGESLPLDSKGRLVLVTNFSSVDKLDEFIQLKKENKKFTGDVKYENGGSGFWDVFWQIFPFIFLIFFWIFIMRRMGGGGGSGIFSFGKSKAKLFDGGASGKDKITFKDVAGLSGAKQEVQEVVDFLRNPQKYTELGGKIPKGILLVGPPGTGKTLLAKAVAGEANVSFFSLSGSDFVEMFVGVGASRVRDLFQQAKQKAPCIVFIDEIDAIGRARSGKASIQSNDERESTLNQLLTEMDGFGANTGVIVMAATNRADILDKALLRAGRFDRQITVELPDLKERQQIFNVHLKPIKIDETVDVETLARQTPGLSGADIANVCNEAALIAARRKKEWVDKQCFLDAVDRVLGGLEKKTKVMTESEKRTIAIHEAGHATISWFLQHANPLVKVTIVPRGNALGANWYMPEERPVTTKEELLDQICGLLGGRAAEELFTGHICTGASNDLERVTKMVYGMISIYGMGEKMPNVNYYNFSENAFSRPYSETTAQVIDEEVKEMIQIQYERAKNVLLQHSSGLQELAQLLIDKEVIYPADLETIFGPRQWKSRSDEIMELNEMAKDDNINVNGEEPVDFADENAEIIRKKALVAVMEKQRRKEELMKVQERRRMEEQRRTEEQRRKEQQKEEERKQMEERRRIEELRREETLRMEEEQRLHEKAEEEEMRRRQMEEDYMRQLDEDKDGNDMTVQLEGNKEIDNEIDAEAEDVKNEDEENKPLIEETKPTTDNVELSLFPDMDKSEADDSSQTVVNDDDVYAQDDKLSNMDDYNPFLDSWSDSSTSEMEKQGEDKNEYDMMEDSDYSGEVVDEDENGIKQIVAVDSETDDDVDNQEDLGDNAYEDNETRESQDDETSGLTDDVEADSPEFLRHQETDYVQEDIDQVLDEDKNDEFEEYDVKMGADELDKSVSYVEKNEDDEEEEIIISSRKRRNYNIEEVIPDNLDEKDDDEEEIVIDLDDE